MKLKTYHFEQSFAFIILLSTAFLSGGELVDFIQAAAGFFCFRFIAVNDRQMELARHNKQNGQDVLVECHYKAKYDYLLKEGLFALSFLMIGAYPLLISCFMFAMYPLWRKEYRKRYPLGRHEKSNI